MNRISVLLLFAVFVYGNAPGQDTVKTTQRQLLQRSIFPITLIGTGLLLNNSNYEKEIQKDIHKFIGVDYKCSIDDYLQYMPVAQLYTGDILGVKSRNHWFDQSKYLLMANIVSSGITHGIKNIYVKERPNGDVHSFPSGHTSFAFVNATVLYNEYIDSSPVLAYSGYAFAFTTGIFRIFNNKHWTSDVLAGAGIGILSADLVYYFEPFKKFNPFKTSKKMVILPFSNSLAKGLYFIVSL